MKSILHASRLILVTNLIVQSAGAGYAPTGTVPTSFQKPLMGEERVKKMDARAQARIKSAYAQLPFYFEANRGQAGGAVKFLARGPGYGLFLTSSEATLVLQGGRTAISDGRNVIRIDLKGSNPDPLIEGRGLLPGKSNYLIGNDSKKWHTGVPQYSKVQYNQVYPGIDMVYYGHQGQLEYDFVVAPGANPGQIRMEFWGAKNLTVDQQGDLVLSVKGRRLTFKAPMLYQKIGDARSLVEGRFVLAGSRQVRLKVGAYDKTKELVIDPSLAYSTYLGTSVEDRANAIAVDAVGTVYLTGQTAPVADLFPGTAGHFQAANAGGSFDAFVTKISAAGAIVWSTYLGGGAIDIGKSIAVDALGIVHITGSTTSSGVTPFPTVNPFQVANGGGTDAFVTAIAADGNSLVYSTYLGGAGVESGNGITVDSAGNAYVTGGITSDNTTRTATVGAFQTNNGGPGGTVENAFVAKFNPAGGIGYFTYLGGSVVGGTHGNAITIDGTGNAYVTGQCRDTFPTFPLNPAPGAGAFKKTITGAQDAFVAKISPTGASLLYSSYLGGSGIAEGTGIKLDSAGNVYIAGDNNSTDFPDAGSDGVTTSMPKVGQTTIVGNFDGFIMKMALNAAGHSDGVYCTFLGGSGLDHVDALVVDSFGDAYVTGRTASGDFLTAGPGSIQTPLDTTLAGAADKVFVTEIGPAGNTRVWNTYIGGVTDQEGMGIGLDAVNNIYVAGWTSSADFPTVTPALFSALKGPFDAFVLKVGAPTPSSGTGGTILTPGFSITPIIGTDAGGTQVVITGAGLTGAAQVTFGGVIARSFTVDSNTQITAISPAHGAGPAIDVIVNRLTGGNAIAGHYTYTSTRVSSSGAGSYIFPSPANGPTADIVYTMAESGTAEIRVYNEIGDLVTRVTDSKPVGQQSSTIHTDRLAPGVYFYILNLNYNSGDSDKRKLKKFVVKH